MEIFEKNAFFGNFWRKKWQFSRRKWQFSGNFFTFKWQSWAVMSDFQYLGKLSYIGLQESKFCFYLSITFSSWFHFPIFSSRHIPWERQLLWVSTPKRDVLPLSLETDGCLLYISFNNFSLKQQRLIKKTTKFAY